MSDRYLETRAQIDACLFGAPPASQVTVGHQLGFLTESGYRVCGRCAARIVGRGFVLPKTWDQLEEGHNHAGEPCDFCRR